MNNQENPSLLTTLQRELATQKEIFETRLNAIDKATSLFQENLTRVPTEVDKQIAHLKALHEVRFDSIDVQFKERDVRVEQTARDTKVAVDAALQAAEKAVGKQNDSNAASITKSELATGKQLDGIQLLLASNERALNDKIADIKGRLDRGEGGAATHAAEVASQAIEATHRSQGNMLIIGIVSVLVSLIIAGVGYFSAHSTANQQIVAPAVVPLQPKAGP